MEALAVCSFNNRSTATPAAVSALASAGTMNPEELATSRFHHASADGKTDDLKWLLSGLNSEQQRIVREWVWESYRDSDGCSRTAREFVRHVERTLGDRIQQEALCSDLPPNTHTS